ncbi:MAG: hypothetical protein MJ097_02485, partial [Dorea sp.]|nr:hypothetical protein [Dorea sp.]
LLMIGAALYGPQLPIILYRSVAFSFVRTNIAIIVRYWSGFSVWTFIAYAPTFSKLVYLAYVYAILFTLYLIYRIGQMKELLTEKELRILEVGRATAYVAIVVLFNYLFIQRYMYVLAYILAMLIPLYLKYIKRSTNELLLRGLTVLVMSGLFFLNDLYMILVNATGVYFLAR